MSGYCHDESEIEAFVQQHVDQLGLATCRG